MNTEILNQLSMFYLIFFLFLCAFNELLISFWVLIVCIVIEVVEYTETATKPSKIIMMIYVDLLYKAGIISTT